MFAVQESQPVITGGSSIQVAFENKKRRCLVLSLSTTAYPCYVQFTPTTGMGNSIPLYAGQSLFINPKDGQVDWDGPVWVACLNNQTVKVVEISNGD